jgi:hypothetical protein
MATFLWGGASLVLSPAAGAAGGFFSLAPEVWPERTGTVNASIP